MLRRLCAFLLVPAAGALWGMPSQPPDLTLDDYVGTVDTAGVTYSRNYHGSGRMIGVDDYGIVHLAWTGRGQHIFFNAWDPDEEDFLFDGTGVRVDTSLCASGVTMAVTDAGFSFIAFHERTNSPKFHTVVGGEPAFEPDWCYDGGVDLELMWPKIGVDIHRIVHLISTEHPSSSIPGLPRRLCYSRGRPEFDEYGFCVHIDWDAMSCGAFDMWDTVMVVASDVACSRHSNRCAIAWLHSMDDLNDNPSPHNHEVYMRVSEDGGLNWGDRINVTQWTPWDPECYHSGGDPLACDRDTFRCYSDVSILFDESSYVHLAFTTIGFWWYLPGESDSGFVEPTRSMIYHWSEQTGWYSLVANGWYAADAIPWQHNVGHPTLAMDTTTGFLYCSYQRYDSITYGGEGFRSADTFVSVSTDGGSHWAVGTNVANTQPDSAHAMHEDEISVAPFVTDGFLHMQYLLDMSGGSPPALSPII